MKETNVASLINIFLWEEWLFLFWNSFKSLIQGTLSALKYLTHNKLKVP
jgi:hypothetical protein